MSKPFVVRELVSQQVTVRTLDGASSVVVGPSGVAAATSGAGKRAEVTAEAGADVHIATDAAGGSGVLIEVPGHQAIQLFTDGNIYVFNPGGNIVTTADHIFDNANNVELIGANLVQQTMLESTAVAVLAGAAINYDELSSADVAALRSASRLNVQSNAAGTTIRSLFTVVATPNPPRVIWIQNTGAATLTLSNQDVAGTVGGRFFGPADCVIRPGGGVEILFDSGVTADGAWLVHEL